MATKRPYQGIPFPTERFLKVFKKIKKDITKKGKKGTSNSYRGTVTLNSSGLPR